MREKILYEETYRKGAVSFRQANLPDLHHTLPDRRVVECELRRAGRVERDGKILEFQDLRVYLTDEPPPLAPDTVAVEDGVS